MVEGLLQEERSAFAGIANVAASIVDGKINAFDGSRRLAAMCWRLPPEQRAVASVFQRVSSALLNYPEARERHLWDPEVLYAKTRKRRNTKARLRMALRTPAVRW